MRGRVAEKMGSFYHAIISRYYVNRFLIIKFWQHIDFYLLVPVITLCVFGLVAVFWAGLSPQFSSPFLLFKAKLTFFIPGLLIALCLSAVDYHLYENSKLQISLSLAVIFFLVLLFFLGPREFGANLRFLMFNKSIQPAEYAKIIIVVVLSYTISETYRRGLVSYFIFSIHTALLLALFVLIALQPDYGAVLILFATSLCMLIAARIEAKKSLLVVLSVSLAGCLGIIGLCGILPKYQYVLERFKIFFECFFVEGCHKYQINNAYHAIISGRLFGNNITDAIHPHGVLPMECNDFIYCVIAEESGFIGIVMLVLIYSFFIKRGFSIARDCRDFFGQLMAFGLTCMIGLQALINMLVATGLMPTTGITLPFVSHGGNSMLSSLIAVGILLNISKNTFRI